MAYTNNIFDFITDSVVLLLRVCNYDNVFVTVMIVILFSYLNVKWWKDHRKHGMKRPRSIAKKPCDHARRILKPNFKSLLRWPLAPSHANVLSG